MCFCLHTELRSTGTAHHFAYLLNTTDYRILRMDEDHDRMYVGSKDHILSLDLHDINKDPHIVRRFPCFLSPLIPIPQMGCNTGLQEVSLPQRNSSCSAGQILFCCPSSIRFWLAHSEFFFSFVVVVGSLNYCNWAMTIPTELIFAWVDVSFYSFSPDISLMPLMCSRLD